MKTKEMGQVFTPPNIVCDILNKVDFVGYNTLTNTIMEASFGDGAFLVQIVERIVKEGRLNCLSDDEIVSIVCNHVYGIEKDKKYYDKAIENVRTVMQNNGILYNGDFPNLTNGDTFQIYEQYIGEFDILVNNPPYVNLHSILERDVIRQFDFSKSGMTDLYIAFFEIGIKMSKENGKLGYITPNSYFTSKAGQDMRKYIIDNQMLVEVVDYGHHQVFENALTYACITILDKQNKDKSIKFTKQGQKEKTLKYDDFYINGSFYFGADPDFRDIINFNGRKQCSVKNGCATLMDDFFINSEIAEKSKFSIPIVKTSTGKRYRCFYPYDKNGKVLPYSEIEKDDVSAKILQQNKERLLSRSIVDENLWYAFGRTQAIPDTYKNKYGINAIYRKAEDVHVTPCEVGCAVYGGMYILTDLPIDKIKSILCSQEYIDYVSTIGKYKSGGYYTVSTKDIEKFLNYKLLH